MTSEALRAALAETRAYFCLSCGKCTASCPMARWEDKFSPRRLVESLVMGDAEEVLAQEALWQCLTCLRCEMVCPSGVRLGEFVRRVRTVAREQAFAGQCTHGGAVEAWMRLMAQGGKPQARLRWLEEDPSLEVEVWPSRGGAASPGKGERTLFFVGCLPYYQVLFGDLGLQGEEMARQAVRLLNALGIRPVVLADERCCGHDLLWQGDEATFGRLLEANARLVAEAGVERIVTLCPECALTLAKEYPARLGAFPPAVHLSEVAAQALQEGRLTFFRQAQGPVTYQDPCRLGRHLGIYEAPRALLEGLGYTLVEMAHHRKGSLCCGTSAWTHCTATSRAIQEERLREARETGASVLVTACPKCQIHFRCALAGGAAREGLAVEVRDWVSLVAEALGGAGEKA
ncbi:MAG: (Fe-S)-binding protein [Anaerolineae bacterium]